MVILNEKNIKLSWHFLFSKQGHFFYSIFFLVFSIPLIVNTSWASVTGDCVNCHTMHNSEDGDPVVSPSQAQLLATDCVSCHSSPTSQTIVNLNGSNIPIVLNSAGYPPQPLAGGNFYNVSLGGLENDVFGHNVWGVSEVDGHLSEAPGDNSGCNISCHESLATDPEDILAAHGKAYGTTGCQGCHQTYKHHGTDPVPGTLETEESGWYRYLSGHGFDTVAPAPGYHVDGVEDANWEQNPSAGHNKYKGVPFFYFGGGNSMEDSEHSMTAFCRGCHTAFHGGMSFGGAHQSPWLRHPSDFALPETGEYAGYDPVTNYDPLVPVAWENPEIAARSEAIVMCLSCHRAHGSEYPDMLRWDYSEMEVGTTGTGAGNGCFVCHTQKDAL